MKKKQSKKKHLYNDAGEWLNKTEVFTVHNKTEDKIKKILEELFDAGWSIVEVERMLIDAVRWQSTMLSFNLDA